MAVFFPFSAVSSLPAEVIYQKPPIMRNSTAMPKAMPSIQLMTVLISWLTEVPALQFKPEEGSHWKLEPKAAMETAGANTNVAAKITSNTLRKFIFLAICFNLFTPSRLREANNFY